MTVKELLIIAGTVALALALMLCLREAHATDLIGEVRDGYTVAAVILSQIFSAGVVWGAVRADIRHLHEKVQAAHEAAKEAHERIDDILQRGLDRRK